MRHDLAPVRAAVRGIGFLSLTGLCVVLFLLAPKACLKDRIRMLWSAGSCRVLGIKVEKIGYPVNACPTLFVANHISYLDIIVLGSVVDARFISKSDVADWPLFGFIAKLTDTMFIRRRRCEALIQRNRLVARMRQGQSYILFAEGTSTNGMDVRKFKSSLVSAAEPWIAPCPVGVQSIAIRVEEEDGESRAGIAKRHFAWFGDEDFLPHLKRVLMANGYRVMVKFGEHRMSWSVRDRKELTAELERKVRQFVLKESNSNKHANHRTLVKKTIFKQFASTT